MSKPFKKSVVVDSMEYDRLRQRQVREYQPELSKLAQLQDQMAAILGNRKLSDHQKIVMLADPRAQFDKLRAELGVLSGTVRETNGSAVAIGNDDSAPAAPKEPDSRGGPYAENSYGIGLGGPQYPEHYGAQGQAAAQQDKREPECH